MMMFELPSWVNISVRRNRDDIPLLPNVKGMSSPTEGADGLK